MAPALRIDVLTLFPGMFEPVLGASILKRARAQGTVRITVHDLRQYTRDRHRTADDKPFGGGPGMVLKVEPIVRAVRAIGREAGTRVVLLTPQGAPLTQARLRALAAARHLVLICGHYEGVDERVRTAVATEEVSIGDYVLTCGELPAMVLIDGVVRLLPGALGDDASTASDSFSNGLLEHPQYTRPAAFEGLRVPAVLVSGDHQRIAAWRRRHAVARTRQRRPDLLTEGETREAASAGRRPEGRHGNRRTR